MTPDQLPETLPETLKHIFDTLEDHFKGKGVASSQELALDTCMLLARDFGGLQVYIPKAEATKRYHRDIEIFNKSGTVKASRLAVEYGISVPQVHFIIKRIGKKKRKPL